MGLITVAAVQMRAGTHMQDNIRDMEAMVRDAAAKGALYVQTPEMTGLVQRDREAFFKQIFDANNDPLLERAEALSRELGIWLHIGSIAVRASEEKAANRGFLFSPRGNLVATYDKIHLFDVDLGEGQRWRESTAYQHGQMAVIADTTAFKLGMSICYDLRFPQLYRQLAKSGAQALSCPSVFTVPTGEKHWHTLLRARAIENRAFMIAAAQGGLHEDGRRSYGHSAIIDPDGVVIAELNHDEPEVLVAEIDLGMVSSSRASIPNLDNERRFAISTTSEEEVLALQSNMRNTEQKR